MVVLGHLHEGCKLALQVNILLESIEGLHKHNMHGHFSLFVPPQIQAGP